MPDKFDKQIRSRMMSGIKCKNTKPEIKIRKALYGKGFRYRLHDKKLPGKPDIILRKFNTVIFVHGCFWHGHNCQYFKWPKSNINFWQEKISKNKENDLQVIKKLDNLGFRICIIWECITRDKELFPEAMDLLRKWLVGKDKYLEIPE